MPIWQCGRFRLSFERPAIMAIINVTPDSFSGDGLSGNVDAALRQAEQALSEGASILDVGGESTRPGSAAVSEAEELARVIPVVEALARLGVPVSVDTLKPAVMRESIRAGAAIINDINALREPGALEAVAASDAGVCLMHMQGEPRTMQQAPVYGDVVADVDAFLQTHAAAVLRAGVAAERICLDPGFGFGKTLAHNLALFRALPRFVAQPYPVLVGVSRKSMLGALTGREVGQRMPASITAAVLAAQRGAAILRVHDVAATRDALTVWAAIDDAEAR
ncbi:MAG: dihydropteroate synthase [Candidatus Dactylopiibacterium carminicum]|uniref:dihydropteroate synthase n=1 Tax=Candidatus Dactylopiibacterium carminicum TaxID=857335 RepID=A0A272EQ00_9RHOO|nr:dihydropteroate synthase [Candidatus Dactylopiibacterium carminicum]KAF7598441.1 dihydropteroate synthase [Candidatus Dactylopiibacterium carminicum]PAS92193.1 MAG: dihydropteroate synthase [Candidatus Dactylopiibacterium carminicum]PAS95684.1 MAG: dihydropteroate synthase [Candidatus Dactylopiibacterium carminicum]PAS97675.1 MAG: dihydropteroate synthase [Candidatus Dactylopiibacterium carminicum]